jgi:hypothetical protein
MVSIHQPHRRRFVADAMKETTIAYGPAKGRLAYTAGFCGCASARRRAKAVGRSRKGDEEGKPTGGESGRGACPRIRKFVDWGIGS